MIRLLHIAERTLSNSAPFTLVNGLAAILMALTSKLKIQ
jgi:hypothetical protein